MFAKMFLVLAVGVSGVGSAKPEPAAFKVFAEEGVTVKMESMTIKPGTLYVTEPMIGEREVSFVFEWESGGKLMTRTVSAKLVAGYMTVVKFATPKEWIVAMPGEPRGD